MTSRMKRTKAYEIETAIYHTLKMDYGDVEVEVDDIDSVFRSGGIRVAIGESKSSGNPWTIGRLFKDKKRVGPIVQLWNGWNGKEKAVILASSTFTRGTLDKVKWHSDRILEIPEKYLQRAIDSSRLLVTKRSSKFNLKGVLNFLKHVHFYHLPEDRVVSMIEDWCRENGKGTVQANGIAIAKELFLSRSSSHRKITRTELLEVLIGKREQISLSDKILSLHAKRIEAIRNGSSFVEMDTYPKIVFHLVPEATYNLKEKLRDLSIEELMEFNPPGYRAPNRPARRNDGALIIKRQRTQGRVQSYTHVNNNGCIEVVYLEEIANNIIDWSMIIPRVRDSLWDLVKSYRGIGVDFPLWFCMSFVGAKGYQITKNSEYLIESEELTSDVISITDEDQGPIDIIWPAFRKIWKHRFDDIYLHVNDYRNHNQLWSFLRSTTQK